LDAGDSGVTAAAARWNRKGDYALEGVCRVSSKGFRKGMVTDVAGATETIVNVLDKLKKRTGRKARDVFAGVSSPSIEITPSSGALLLSKYGREISKKDIDKCVEMGAVIKMPLNKELLHRIVCGFSIDGEAEIKDPLNMEGVKLQTRVNVLTINSSVVHNMARCISQAGFVPAGFVFSGFASACRVLTEKDTEGGVLLLNIHRALVEVMVFCRGMLTGCKVFHGEMCGNLSELDSIDPEKLKELTNQISSVPGWPEARKVVVSGEGATIENLIESLDKLIALPVVAGTCAVRPFEDLPAGRAEYTGSLGILDHILEERRLCRPPDNLISNNLNKAVRFLDRYF